MDMRNPAAFNVAGKLRTGRRCPVDDFAVLNMQVTTLMRQVAADVVLPHFRCLAQSQISEKSPGEVVTIADHECERRLTDGLAALDLDGRIVGEEAAAIGMASLEDMDRGLVWIIDPIDGTRNYARGCGPFGLMIALAYEGVVEAGWLYDPLTGRMCYARRGGGAWVNGIPLRTRVPTDSRPIAALALQFMPEDARERAIAHAIKVFDLTPIPYCAAEHYPRLAFGQNHVALFQRTLPWDHAAGALFLTEAGGCVTRWDGSDYCFYDDQSGIIATTHRSIHQLALTTLTGEATGLATDCSVTFQSASFS